MQILILCCYNKVYSNMDMSLQELVTEMTQMAQDANNKRKKDHMPHRNQRERTSTWKLRENEK